MIAVIRCAHEGCTVALNPRNESGYCVHHAPRQGPVLHCRCCGELLMAGEERYRFAITSSGGFNASGRLRAWLCKRCGEASEKGWDKARKL